MADVAASVLARLKTSRSKVAEAINSACCFFVRKNFSDVWRNPNMPKTSC